MVRAMALDEMVLDSLRWPFEHPGVKKDANPAMLACISRIPAEPFVGPLVKFVAAELAAREMNEATEFFKTNAWQKMRRYGIQSASRAMFNDTNIDREPNFTREEQAAFARFAGSRAGKKILTENFLSALPIQDELTAIWDKGLRACEERFEKKQ